MYICIYLYCYIYTDHSVERIAKNIKVKKQDKRKII